MAQTEACTASQDERVPSDSGKCRRRGVKKQRPDTTISRPSFCGAHISSVNGADGRGPSVAGPTSPVAPWAVRSSKASKTTPSNGSKATATAASGDTHIKHCVPVAVPDGRSLEVVGAGRIAPRCRHSVDIPRPPPLSLAALASSSSASRDELMQLLPLRQLSPGAAGPGLPDTALQGAPRPPGSSPRLHRSGSLRAPRPPGPQPGVRVGAPSPPPPCAPHAPQPSGDGLHTSSVSPFVGMACAWEATSGGGGGGGGGGGIGAGAVAGSDGGLPALGGVIGTSLTDVFAAHEAARRKRGSSSGSVGGGNGGGSSICGVALANRRGGAASEDGSDVHGGCLQAAASGSSGSGSSCCASPYGGWAPSTAPSSGNPYTPPSQYAPYATITVTRAGSVSCSGELGHGGRGATLGAATPLYDTTLAAAGSAGPPWDCQSREGSDAEDDGRGRGQSCPLPKLQGSQRLGEQQQQLPQAGLVIIGSCASNGGRAAPLSTSLSASMSGALGSPAQMLLGGGATVAQASAVQAQAMLPVPAAADQQPAVGRPAFRRSSATGTAAEDSGIDGRRLQRAGASLPAAGAAAAASCLKQSVRDSVTSLSCGAVPWTACRGKGEARAEAGAGTSVLVDVRLLPELAPPQAQPQLRPRPSADTGQVPLQHFPSSSASSRRSSATGGSGSVGSGASMGCVGSSRRSSRASGCGGPPTQPEAPLRLPPVGPGVSAGVGVGAAQADRGGQGRLSSMGSGDSATSCSTDQRRGSVGVLGTAGLVTPMACFGGRASLDTGCLGLVGMGVGAVVGAGADLGAGYEGADAGELQQRKLQRNGSGSVRVPSGWGSGGGSGGGKWRARRLRDPFVAAAAGMAAGAGVGLDGCAGAACGRSCCGAVAEISAAVVTRPACRAYASEQGDGGRTWQ